MFFLDLGRELGRATLARKAVNLPGVKGATFCPFSAASCLVPVVYRAGQAYVKGFWAGCLMKWD